MISFKKFIPGIAWFFFVLFLLCLPGNKLPRVEDWMTAVYFDKWVHLFLFTVLSLLFMWPVAKSGFRADQKNKYLFRIAIAVSCWGLITEIIQGLFIPDRSFDLKDWAADTMAAVLALLIARKFSAKKIPPKRDHK